MKTATPMMSPNLHKVMIAAYAWLRIALSYCVVGAVITTLVSAYLQTVSILTITLIMTSFLGIGVYKAEMTRHDSGLNNYVAKLSQQKHRDF